MECREGERAPVPPPFRRSMRAALQARKAASRGQSAITTSNAIFNEMLCRCTSDLAMLLTATEHGPYPYAGIPWYSTTFGRDGIITAIQTLWCRPDIARGVLRHLAALQADDFDPQADAEPGKILHEMRNGEMARLGEVPFRRYYGSVDSTPLFVLLAGLYLDRTGDLGLLDELWPNIERAIAWIDGPGDPDGDGFVEYHRANDDGLVNQGWKDFHDSIFHADGTTAAGPIALCEVQGYVYAAKVTAANVARRLGHHDMADRLALSAEDLRVRFEDAFWCDDIGSYALALDGRKAALPGAQFECRSGSVQRHCVARARRSGGATIVAADILFRLGDSDDRARGSALQSDVVSQRIDLAARQFADRRRLCALRTQERGHARVRRPVRRGRLHGLAASARTLLRVSALARPRPDALSGRLLAAGLGRRRTIPDDPGRTRN